VRCTATVTVVMALEPHPGTQQRELLFVPMIGTMRHAGMLCGSSHLPAHHARPTEVDRQPVVMHIIIMACTTSKSFVVGYKGAMSLVWLLRGWAGTYCGHWLPKLQVTSPTHPMQCFGNRQACLSPSRSKACSSLRILEKSRNNPDGLRILS
jgi:hypothetical protein